MKTTLILLAALSTLTLTACGRRDPDVNAVTVDLKNGSISAIAVADVDGDGKPDIVYGQSGEIFILKNTGGGRFILAPSKEK